ncbi:hypothetical protein MN116_000321, partial [Schistosoma mekongi]
VRDANNYFVARPILHDWSEVTYSCLSAMLNSTIECCPVSTGAEADASFCYSSTCLSCFLSFESNSGLLKHAQLSHPEIILNTSSLRAPSNLLCMLCSSSFSTSRGFTQRLRHVHPEAYNHLKCRRLNASPLTHRSWSSEEDCSLLSNAEQLSTSCRLKLELYKRLHLIFPSRSPEAIKKRLRYLSSSSDASSSAPPPSDISISPSSVSSLPVDLDSPPRSLTTVRRPPRSHSSSILSFFTRTPRDASSSPSPIVLHSSPSTTILINNASVCPHIGPPVSSHILETSCSSLLAASPSLDASDVQQLAVPLPLPCTQHSLTPPPMTATSPVTQSEENPAPTSTLIYSSPTTIISINATTVVHKPFQPIPSPRYDDDRLQSGDPILTPSQSSFCPTPLSDEPPAMPCNDDFRALASAALRLITPTSPLLHAPLLRSFLETALIRTPDTDDTQFILNSHAELAFPKKWCPSKLRQPPNVATTINRKQLRRIQYGHIQTLYLRSQRDAANTVLDGRWRTPLTSSPFIIPEFENFWETVFTAPSVPDNRSVTPVVPVCPTLIAPISPAEVKWALSDMRNSATGVDKLTALHFLKSDVPSVAGYLNMVLAFEYLPTNLLMSRVTFIPKCTQPSRPNDFRPVSIAPVITRCLHKVLAKRWSPLFPPSKLQFAFLQRDGCFESINLLHSIIRYAHDRHTGCCIAFLDISRAFDSVSHDSILRAARRFGAPDGLCRYLQRVYGASTSCFNTFDCTPRCGVKQGDPLSPQEVRDIQHKKVNERTYITNVKVK